MGKKSVRKTHDEFMIEVYEKNKHVRNGDIEILGMYVDAKTRIKCFCHKHNILWSSFPDALYRGCGCKQCGHDKTNAATTKTHEQFILEVYNKNEYVQNGDINILGKYVNSHTKIQCRCNKHNITWNVSPDHLLRGQGCKQCGIEKQVLKQRKAHDQFVEEVREMNNGIVPLGFYVNSQTDIPFQCKRGHIWSSSPNKILQGECCPYCSGHRVLPGFNDVSTIRPDVGVLMTNPHDKYKYTSYSSQKIDFTCPICGRIQKKRITNVSTYGFACEYCSDGISYPNKFGRAFFDQLLPNKYETEYSPNWAGSYLYDVHFILNHTSYLVEWDGAFHYEDKEIYGKTLSERQEVDEIKNKLAEDNNMHLIRINCTQSDKEYIKSNILNSELNMLFDLSNIDWTMCDKRAQKNLVNIVCDLYSSGTTSIKDIANKLHISRNTVRDYLKRGTELGWCSYDPYAYLQNLKQPIIVTKISNGQELHFASITECIKKIFEIYGVVLNHSNINRAINNNGSYKGFVFKRACKYNTKLIS